MFDLEDIPFDDIDTYDLIGKGLTKGVFQLESYLAMTWCKKINPRSIEDLSVVLAGIRPGALQELEKYVSVMNKESDIVYLDRRLEPILKPTLGILLYQEQLISIVQQVAGFSEQEADVVRKYVGKKMMKDLKKVRPKFVIGCVKNGVSEDSANKLFDVMVESGSYSFNKSHSISYSINSYKSAYLKAHYPQIFFWANLKCAKLKQKPLKEIETLFWDMKEFGIKLLPPDIKNLSDDFIMCDDNVSITFGISSIKGVGKTSFKLINSLSKEKTWRNLLLAIVKKNISKAKIEPTIKSGVFDCYGISRSRMFSEYCFIKELSGKQLEIFISIFEKNVDQDILKCYEKIFLANKRLKKSKKTEDFKKMLEMSVDVDYNISKDMYERKYLGVNLTATRVDDFSDSDTNATCKQIKEEVCGNFCVIAVLENVNKIKTRKDKKEMAFLEISDMTQKISNVVVFNNVFIIAYYEDFLLRNIGEEVLKISGFKNNDSFVVTNMVKIG